MTTVFEPVLVIYGSPETIAKTHFAFPVKTHFAFDQVTLQQLLQTHISPYVGLIPKYFLVLLIQINDVFRTWLQNHQQIGVIYSRETYTQENKTIRPIHPNSQQFILDLVGDIVSFLNKLKVKEEISQNSSTEQIYSRQARILKEWAMSSVKAEASHILLIPLNTDEKNLIDAQKKLQNLTQTCGYAPTIVRVLNDYLPLPNGDTHYLLPYGQLLFNQENSSMICRLIKNLCPVRFYLYGNEKLINNSWANEMIRTETSIMNHEDNWCAFLENEPIRDDVKWNLAVTYSREWNVKLITPIRINALDQNIRFYSAFRRSQRKIVQRQIQVTADIFKWYDEFILREKNISLSSSPIQANLSTMVVTASDGVRVRLPSVGKTLKQDPSSIIANPNNPRKKLCFIWLDRIIHSDENFLNKIIAPSRFVFFYDATQCLDYMQRQSKRNYEIFFVSSGHSGLQAFSQDHRLLAIIRYIYILFCDTDPSDNWTHYYRHIRGVFYNKMLLTGTLKKDLDDLKQNELVIHEDDEMNLSSSIETQASTGNLFQPTGNTVPMLIYNRDQEFITHQRIINDIVSSGSTSESFSVMIDEFCRFYEQDLAALFDIDHFQRNYCASEAIQWYTRDSFLYRFVNGALRSNDFQTMFKVRSFLSDLYVQLDQLYKIVHQNDVSSYKEIVYRGQTITREDFHRFQENIGEIITIKTFFSTTMSLEVALHFVDTYLERDDKSMAVIIRIEINIGSRSSRPYADISHLSIYSNEDEVLFAMGSLFRILSIQQFESQSPIQLITLELIQSINID